MQKQAVFERILDQFVNPKLYFKEFIQNPGADVGFFINTQQGIWIYIGLLLPLRGLQQDIS